MAHDQDGRLHIVGGGLRSLAFPGFPATYPRLALAVGLELSAEELGTPHQVRIEAHGPSAEPIAKPQELSLNVPGDQRAPAYFNFVYNMEKVSFPLEGDYGFAILVDGSVAQDVLLRAETLPGPVPASVVAAQLLNQGYEAFSAGDADGAAAIFKEVTERFPQDAGGHNNLGFVLLAKGDAVGALDSFAKAAELNYPQNEISDANRACALYLAGDKVAAFGIFVDCLRTHIFRTTATLLGIGESGLFAIQLNSAAEYVALMSLNAAWSSFGTADDVITAHYLAAARSAELTLRTDISGKLFIESVRSLAAKAR